MASIFTPWGFLSHGTGQAIAENKVSDKIILPRQIPGQRIVGVSPWNADGGALILYFRRLQIWYKRLPEPR
jgi:hypothetical protein